MNFSKEVKRKHKDIKYLLLGPFLFYLFCIFAIFNIFGGQKLRYFFIGTQKRGLQIINKKVY